MQTIDFSAKEPSLGYFYQMRYALYVLLDEDNPDTSIKIESLDDIELIEGDATSLIQTKYHKKSTTNLTDRHPDFWKTIRIWSHVIKNDYIDSKNARFILVSTDRVSVKSIIKEINDKTNINEIISKLDLIAREKNKENQKGYDAYISLTQDEKEILLNNITIFDNAIDFKSIDKQIVQLLRLATTPNLITALYERLSGWWLEQSILNLQDKIEKITLLELQNKIWHINDQLKSDNLPIDYPDRIDIDDGEFKKKEKMTYVKQLDLISISDNIKRIAMSDYMRAFNQRSKWIREELLNPNEDIYYDNKLYDYWYRHFENLVNDTNAFSPGEIESYGKKFYENYFYKNTPPIYIRDRCTDIFVVLGSIQMLSDKKKVGWHPKYMELLED